MMKNVRKSKWRQLKLLLLLPLIGGFLWAFSQPDYQLNPYEDTGAEINSVKTGKKIKVKGTVNITDTVVLVDKETGQYQTKVVSAGMPGVNILLKNKTNGCVTDLEGKFTLDAEESDILVFSCVGFKTVERKVQEGKEVHVNLKPTSYELDPAPFRAQFKGKMTPPPPPPPIAKNEKAIIPPPPPPPPSEKDESVFFIVEDLPNYVGGMETYFAKMYTSIEQAKKKNKLSGVVKVKFTVNAKGDVINVNALSNSKKKEVKVAEEIVAGLNEWKPAKQRGKAIACTLIVPVEFN